MTWKDERRAEIHQRAQRYRHELEADWVRAVDTFNGRRPNGSAFVITRSKLVRRDSFAVERYGDRFTPLDKPYIDGRVRSFALRERTRLNVD
jgi:hypothetical protein